MEEEADDPGARVGPARERRPLRGSPAGGEMVPPRTKSQAGRPSHDFRPDDPESVPTPPLES